MMVYLNGRFVPEEKAVISIHDRGFQYGDGLFETVRVYAREPFLWRDHIARFERGCEGLRIRCPLTSGEIRQVLRELVTRNNLSEALVRFTLSRGCGPRGYSPRGADDPTFVMAAFPAPLPPTAFKAIVSTVQLADRDAMAEFKHLNKLHQIVARAEADAADAHEALLANESGYVVEGTTTNVFWVKDGAISTPPLQGILPGTTRAHIFRLGRRLGIRVIEEQVRPKDLFGMDGIFVTSCAVEVMELSHLNGQRLKQSALVKRLRGIYRQE